MSCWATHFLVTICGGFVGLYPGVLLVRSSKIEALGVVYFKDNRYSDVIFLANTHDPSGCTSLTYVLLPTSSVFCPSSAFLVPAAGLRLQRS
jgi:hypothetical protein